MTKHARVKRALLEKIAQGVFAPSGLLPPDRELMREFGVCRQTIIRAMHDLCAEGVVRREHGRGTFVNDNRARSEVGVLTYINQAGPTHLPYVDNLLRSVLNRLCEIGHRPHLYSTYGESVIGDISMHGQQVLDDCARGGLRCLVVSPSYNAGAVETTLARWGTHVVGLHSEKEGLSTFNVGVDSGSVVEAGLRDLRRRGFRRVALIAGRPMYAAVPNVVQTYLNVMEQSRIAVRPGWIRTDLGPSPQSGHEQFVRLWSMDDRPEALLINDDYMALGATRAMVELGVTAGKDLTVMVLTNRWSKLVFPLPVVALEMDPEPLGAAAADMAQRLLRGEPVAMPRLRVKPNIRIFDMRDVGHPTHKGKGDQAATALAAGTGG